MDFDKMSARAHILRDKALAAGPFAIIHCGSRYVLTPIRTDTGEFYWLCGTRDGDAPRFLGNTRSTARANLIFWLEH